MLMQLGALTFEVFPFNAHETSRDAEGSSVAKELLGRPRGREVVGEGDDRRTISGRIFPEKFGGLSGLDTLDAMRRSGEPQLLVRGDFTNLGWYVVESVSERATYLAGSGVGKVIEFDVTLLSAPPPDAGSSLSWLYGLLP